jgi:hypothetical protein
MMVFLRKTTYRSGSKRSKKYLEIGIEFNYKIHSLSNAVLHTTKCKYRDLKRQSFTHIANHNKPYKNQTLWL